MELLLETVVKLRKVYGFNGYIHLKGIPSANALTIIRAGEYVDRMSFNLELPSERSLKLLAPEKTKEGILTPMNIMSNEFRQAKSLKYGKFLPAGQTTQMIVGASPESDGQIVRLTQSLYKKYSLKRVYYSSYIPANDKNPNLPVKPVGLLREHRLYQADWLLRFYGFSASEILDEDENLAEEYDPKCGWALKHPEFFPVEINSAPPETLVRVPGIGFKSAYKIVSARRYHSLYFSDLEKMRVVMKRAKHFITCNGKFFGIDDDIKIKGLLAIESKNEFATQLSLFSSPEISASALLGEL